MSATNHLSQLFEQYKNLVTQNPQVTSDCETAAKWISYYLAGKVHNSPILSELVYSASNLLALFNDRIISRNQPQFVAQNSDGINLKLCLSIIEYSEIFLELSSQKLWGKKGKWIIIVAIQIFKFISHLILIYSHKETIVSVPAIPPLDRRKLKANHPINPVRVIRGGFEETLNNSFTLQSSGRVVRSVEAAPPLNLRNWKPVQKLENDQSAGQILVGRQLLAETIYICKPIAHLLSVAAFGENTWKPWMVSLFLDAFSLHLYNAFKKVSYDELTPKQKMQLTKRNLSLLLYLLRSPFYEKQSKDRIFASLIFLSKNVPLARVICGPLLQYLMYYQNKYFFLWSM